VRFFCILQLYKEQTRTNPMQWSQKKIQKNESFDFAPEAGKAELKRTESSNTEIKTKSNRNETELKKNNKNKKR